MIGKLRGIYGGSGRDGSVIVDVGGVGYVVRVPKSSAERLPDAGAIELFIHTAVREDAIDLYGFPSEEELSFFKLLTSVSGVGPKTALGILNVADVASLARAVAAGDPGVLARVYGVGKKSAERIVVELRDKLANAGAGGAAAGVDVEVMEALEALGYSAVEARHTLREITSVGDVRERLAEALKLLGGPKTAGSK